MKRATNADINAIVGRYARACKSLGMLPKGGFVLDEGSKTDGRAYRLFSTLERVSAPGTINGYLGMTKREAWGTLHTMALTLEDVWCHRDNL